jgi:hypothetical protein
MGSHHGSCSVRGSVICVCGLLQLTFLAVSEGIGVESGAWHTARLQVGMCLGYIGGPWQTPAREQAPLDTQHVSLCD